MGCPAPAPPPPPPKPDAGVTLKISGDANALKALLGRAKGWASRHDATVVLSPVADADVIVTDTAGVGLYAANGDALEVPEEFKTLDHAGQWIRMLPVARDQLGAWNRVPCAWPIAGDGAALVLNADRWNDAAVKTKFLEMHRKPLPAVPATWEDLAEFADVAVALKQTASAPADREFLRIAACFDHPVRADSEAKLTTSLVSFTHDAETGAPRLTTPGFSAAADVMKRINAARTDGDRVKDVASGKTAWAVLTLKEIGTLPKVNGAVPANMLVAPLPGTRMAFDPATGQAAVLKNSVNFVPFHSGGVYGVVRKNCANPAAAWKLLADLGSPERAQELLRDPANGFGPFRGEHIEPNKESLWQAYGFDAARTRMLAEALRRNAGLAIANPALGLRGPDAATLNELLSKNLKDLNAAQAGWDKHDKEQPQAKSWRRHAVGLP